MKLTDDQQATMVRVQRQLMADWSELHWCAGWMLGLEEELWHGSNKEMRPYDLDIADIHVFAKTTGVWCTLEDDVPIAEWEAQHGPPLTRLADDLGWEWSIESCETPSGRQAYRVEVDGPKGGESKENAT